MRSAELDYERWRTSLSTTLSLWEFVNQVEGEALRSDLGREDMTVWRAALLAWAGAVPGAAFERKMRGGRSGPLDLAGLIGSV